MNSRIRQAVAVLVLSATTGLYPSVLAAAPTGESDDDAIRRGLTFRREGEDERALQEFQKAYANGKSTRAVAQIGLAEQALGRWPDAETHVAQALQDDKDPWIQKNGPILKSALDEIQHHLGSLAVTGPAGAEVLVNGQPIGILPFSKPARVPIGTLNLEVRKDGFYPTTRPVSIRVGMLTREVIGLQPVTSPGLATTSPLQAPARQPDVDSAKPAEVVASSPPTAPDQPATGGWRRPAAWTAAAGAIFASAGGATALVLRSGKLSDANQLSCRISGDKVNPADPVNAPKCVDLANSASRMGVTAVVLFSAAGALAIGSAILFFTSASPDHGSLASLACAPSLFIAGAECRLRF